MYLSSEARQEFLGIVIDSADIGPPPSKVEAIETMQPPSNVEKLRGFLGIIGYGHAAIRSKLQHHRSTANRFTEKQRVCVKKSVQFPNRLKIRDRGDLPFIKKIKIALTSPAVLAVPD